MNKINKHKPTRTEIARIKAQEKREKSHAIRVQIVKIRNDYVTNLVNGRYFLERCNMIAEQLISGKILESIDGCPKPFAFMRAEYAHQKIQALKSMRNAHFAKVDLIEKFEHTKEDITALEKDYYDGKIIREEYDDIYKKRNKSKFVNTFKNKKS